MKGFSIAGIVLVLISSLDVHAGAISKVPFTITKPGKYTLLKNLTPAKNAGTISDTYAILVKASNVEIDFGGFSVIANAEAPFINRGIAIAAGSNEVRIRNGRVTNFGTGIFCGSESSHLVLEDLEVSSPSACATLFTKGATVRRCGFILNSATGTALQFAASGNGKFVHIVESCHFYTTANGTNTTQFGVTAGGFDGPTVVRDCEFVGFGKGIEGNNQTLIANNLFPDCTTTFSGATAVGFNQ